MNSLATLSYEQLLSSRGMRKWFWSLVRHALIKYAGDPACRMQVHSRAIRLPLSHALPSLLHEHPFFDRLPIRVSNYLRARDGRLVCIDVGANVGDTLAALYRPEAADDRFLAIEANPRFTKYLIENWSWAHNVLIEGVMCGAESGSGTYEILERMGTASVVSTGSGSSLQVRALDDLANIHSEFSRVNFLKVDTSGHDFPVLSGARGVIAARQPALLFESSAATDERYISSCTTAFAQLRSAGYRDLLLYDNFGYLMGRYSLAANDDFRKLLFYQLTSPFYYFYVLVMKDADLDRFEAAEVELFVNHAPDSRLKEAAREASRHALV